MSTDDAGGTGKIKFVAYRYEPNLGASVAFTVIFALLAVLHTWRLIRHRSYYFIPFTIGGYLETIGYGGRIWSHFDPTLIYGPYIIQSLLLLIAPAFFAASIYMILGRLIRTLGAEHLAIVRSTWITRIFVTGDVLSFALQGGGGGLLAAGSQKMYEVGEKVVIGGLIVQIVVFGFFIVTAVLFHRKCVREVAIGKMGRVDDGVVVHWRRHLWVLYAVSALIMVRSVFRVVEYAQGNSGYLMSHEVFLYVFDALLMAVVMGLFMVWYVDDIGKARVPGRNQYMEQNGDGTELESQTRLNTGKGSARV